MIFFFSYVVIQILKKKVSLVAIFVCKPLATEIAVLFLCSLELSMQKTKWKRHAVYPPHPPEKLIRGRGKMQEKNEFGSFSLQSWPKNKREYSRKGTERA